METIINLFNEMRACESRIECNKNFRFYAEINSSGQFSINLWSADYKTAYYSELVSDVDKPENLCEALRALGYCMGFVNGIEYATHEEKEVEFGPLEPVVMEPAKQEA